MTPQEAKDYFVNNQSKKNFCDRCGTKIDWSKDDQPRED